ncbi:MAG: urease accessory protein UreF, partial [Pseudomonadota bacterium]
QVAIRLGAFGQQGGVEVLASLEPVLEETAERAATATEDDLGSAALMSDLMAMQHEHMSPRIFLS